MSGVSVLMCQCLAACPLSANHCWKSVRCAFCSARGLLRTCTPHSYAAERAWRAASLRAIERMSVDFFNCGGRCSNTASSNVAILMPCRAKFMTRERKSASSRASELGEYLECREMSVTILDVKGCGIIGVSSISVARGERYIPSCKKASALVMSLAWSMSRIFSKR